MINGFDMIYRYKIPLYFGWLIVYIGDLDKVPEKYNHELKDTENSDGLAYRIDENDVHHFIVAVRPDCTPQIIAHESFHLMNWLFADRGIKYENGNDEHAAYFLGWIVMKVHESVNKFHDK